MKDTSIHSNSTPKFFYNSITDITPEDIFSMGGRAVGIDIDNTTVYDSTIIIFHGVKKWIKKIQDAGIPVIIVTNTYNIRAKILSKMMGDLPFIADADKPDTKCFSEACKITGTDISQFVMIGDQLFTDIQGANTAGAISVRVKWKMRELLLAFYYLKIRKLEKQYLESKGLGDKI